MRLALLDNVPGGERYAHVPRIFVGIGIVRVDDITHLRGERRDGGIRGVRVAERVEADVSVEHGVGQAERDAELGRVAIGGPALRLQRFPEAVHDAFGCFADDVRDVVEPSP